MRRVDHDICVRRLSGHRVSQTEYRRMKLHAPLKTIAPRIQSGDLLLWSGRRVVDRAIAIATRSPYTHAGMAVRQGNVVLVAEMAFSGGRAIDLVSQVRDSPGQWEWRPVASNFNFNRKGA